MVEWGYNRIFNDQDAAQATVKPQHKVKQLLFMAHLLN